jgi:tetratricopeptide (TPR) repeat protein
MGESRRSPAEQVEFERLSEEVVRALHFGKLEQAEAAVRRLIELAPQSTTAQELYGDVQWALRKTEVARQAYRRALELEPANADAERKYAELSLEEGQSRWAVEAILAGDEGRFRGAAHKSPGGAALRSVLFPGLGQLYNGDFDLGVILAAVGLGLFMGLLAFFLAPLVGTMLASFSPRAQATAGPGFWGWASLVGYLLVYIYSIYEAYQAGREAGRR